jgi:predicted RNA-binding Zn-ribbon protein involved in translation (DUF1610 family)
MPKWKGGTALTARPMTARSEEQAMTTALQTIPTRPLVVLNDDHELLCPRCGFNYLHAQQVEVYDRGEDAKQGRHTTVDADADGRGTFSQNTSLRGNPSMRRGAITIDFYCENCGEDRPLRLALSQHKGCTDVHWVDDCGLPLRYP